MGCSIIKTQPEPEGKAHLCPFLFSRFWYRTRLLVSILVRRSCCLYVHLRKSSWAVKLTGKPDATSPNSTFVFWNCDLFICYIMCLVHYSFSLGGRGSQLNHYLRNNNYHYKDSLSPQSSLCSKNGLARCKPTSNNISDESGAVRMAANFHRIIIVWRLHSKLYCNSCQLSGLAARHNSWDKDFHCCRTHIWIL